MSLNYEPASEPLHISEPVIDERLVESSGEVMEDHVNVVVHGDDAARQRRQRDE